MDAGTQVAPRLAWARMIDQPVTGIVLAGGRSQRMGRDKAWSPLAGRPMAQWVLDALQQVTDAQIIVARDAGRLATLGVPVVIDRFAARGALTGIHAGLKAAETDLCLVVACDLPLVQPALLALLADHVGLAQAVVPYIAEVRLPAAAAATPARDAGLQPLLAAYRRPCIEPLEQLLRSGSFPTSALISVLHARVLVPEIWQAADPDGRSFFNVNTPEDLAYAASLLAGAEPV